MKSKTFFYSAFVALGLAATVVSCNKKEDTIAKVYVKDVNNDAVVGAQVVLYGEKTDPNNPAAVILFDTTTTNGTGEAIFNFNDVYQLGQAGVAVLTIDARKDGLIGTGIIKVEQETTSEETVFIQ